MDKFVVEGGCTLTGTVDISGSKNAALPILIASMLADKPCKIRNVPNLKDVRTLLKILEHLGMGIDFATDGTVTTEVKDASKVDAPYDLVSTMRASVAVLGPLLAKRGRADVSLPGGCVIGSRPIDLHLKGFEALGAQITIENGYIHAKADKLKGAEIYLGGQFGSSVLATANVLMAACFAEGVSVIEHAAMEPHIEDLAHFLNAMGAKIQGMGTSRLTVQGVSSLHGADYTIIPDTIESATFLVAGAITKSPLRIRNARVDHLFSVIDKLRESGVGIKRLDDRTLEIQPADRLKAVEITTLPYPGFPTDMQSQFMSLLSLADGTSIITEKVFPDRFMMAGELNRMGARIRREGSTAIITGSEFITGAQVMASDLRASAALVLAALAARGNSEISRVYHIDRGYEKIEQKFAKLGGKIIRVPDR